MGFKYCSVIGETLWPLTKCRPDISLHVIKLSQYMATPAKVHYEALKDICNYLYHTKKDGLYFWRSEPNEFLPEHPLPIVRPDTHSFQTDPSDFAEKVHCYVDSDWGSDQRTRRSIAGVVFRLAGGTIGYFTKYINIIVHSSTEAEFIAACDAGKLILYF
jgi:hypothetical protein